MKKLFYFFALSVTALFALSCERIVEVTPNQEEEIVLSFVSEKPDFSDEAETRTVWKPNEKTIFWGEGDMIRVAIKVNDTWQTNDGDVNYDGEEPTYAKLYTSNALAAETRIAEFKVSSSFSLSTQGSYSFYAFYPSSLRSKTDADEYMPSVTITIPDKQTPPSGSFDPSADVLSAISVGDYNAIPENRIVQLQWTRQVAHGDITLKKLPSFAEDEMIRSIELSAQEGADLVGYHYLNMETGAITLPSTATAKNSITILPKDGNLERDTNDNIEFWFASLPFTATSLKVVLTTNKHIYTKEYTGIEKEFKKNTRNYLGFSMANAQVQDIETQIIQDGYYVISYSDYMMTVGTESNDYRGYESKNVTNPADDAIWRIAYVSESDAYTIRSVGANKDLYGATSSNSSDLKLGTGATNLFTIEKSGSDPVTYKLTPSGNTSRSIGYNTTSPRFALYTGSSAQPITLDLTQVTVDETPIITIDNEERIKTVAASATSVSFNYVPNMFATTAPTVEIANDTDGIVKGTPTAANGTISVELNPNDASTAKSATLTVSGTGIATPITLTINQEAKLGDVFAYAFTSKSWNATRNNVSENWASGKDGAGYSNNGIQVTAAASGANGTSPYKFTDISEIVVTYCTNASSGVGSIKVTVGDNATQTFNVTKPSSGGTTPKTTSFKYTTKESGKVKIEVTCSTNSVFLIGAEITAVSIDIPAPSISVATSAATNISSTEGTTATLNGTITLNNGAVMSNVTEAGFYYKLTEAESFAKVTLSSPPTATSFSFDLSGLTKDSEYIYYAYAKYGSGSEMIGETKTFTPTQGGAKKEYTLTINANSFNTSSYAANNNEKTSNAIASDNSTLEVTWTSNQVMKNGNNMQWQKSNGYIYNSTDLGTIKSVTVNSSAGSFTTYYGTSEHPTSGTTIGNGYFTVNVGSATGTTSSVVIVFEK